MERYSILICQASQRLTIADGLTLDETIELLTLLNRSRPPLTHYLRSRTDERRMEKLSLGQEVSW